MFALKQIVKKEVNLFQRRKEVPVIIKPITQMNKEKLSR